MAVFGDNDRLRFIQRIMCITFRIAKDQLPGTLSRSWIAKYLNRSESFVTRNWNKDPYDCDTNDCTPNQTRENLSQESKDIIIENIGREKKSVNDYVQEIERVRGKKKSYSSVYRFLVAEGAKPFHQIPAPKLSPKNIEDRLWFCDFLGDWDQGDFLFLAPSDEFYIYEQRGPNFQNDRIWALRIEDIPTELKVREQSKSTRCLGIFLLFTAKRLMWVIKEKGCSWDGEYFRNTILTERVIPFLKNAENVISVEDTTFLHDKAPCMKALATQALLKNNRVDFFGNSEWPGSSPDLNACENLGSILKERVEKRISNSNEDLETALNRVLGDLEFDTELFISLLESYPARLDAVRKAGGRHTKY